MLDPKQRSPLRRLSLSGLLTTGKPRCRGGTPRFCYSQGGCWGPGWFPAAPTSSLCDKEEEEENEEEEEEENEEEVFTHEGMSARGSDTHHTRGTKSAALSQVCWFLHSVLPLQ